MSSYLTEALVYERINRYQSEAANERRANQARVKGPGFLDRFAAATARGVSAIVEPLKVDRRPRIPAI
jgi:hypothetical protein